MSHALRDPIQAAAPLRDAIKDGLARVIVGQDQAVEQVLTALLAEGHVLIVGVPGLAKTLLVSTVAQILGLSFRRIQFTPDLMPSDITGTTVVSENSAGGRREFRFLPGPIFAHVVLADEINRTPPKTQAALMEAMEERQVTQGTTRRALGRPFFVLATQNPIEQEGTYPLPISQLDRFLFTVHMDYPTREEEYAIMWRTTSDYTPARAPVLDADTVARCLDRVAAAPIDDHVFTAINALVRATRPDLSCAPPLVRDYVTWGAGPRAAQAIASAARARAVLRGRGAPQLDDVRSVALPALRHRMVLAYHARTEGMSADAIVNGVVEHVLGRDARELPRGG